MCNPLLNYIVSPGQLPPFSEIRPEHVESAIDHILEQNRSQIEQILQTGKPYCWENLLRPLEELDDRLSRVWSPVSHMNSVVNSAELRKAYNACLPKLSDYATEMGQNEELYKACVEVAEGPEYEKLDTAQKKVIDNTLRDFRLTGVALNPKDKKRYKEIMLKLSELTSRFSENVLDATQGWEKQVTELSLLSGMPDSSIALARQTAEQKKKEGWIFTLEFPSYYPAITYADNRELRQELYEAYVTRASDQGPNAGKWNNTPLMEQILSLRHEVAQLLGYANYAERSLATKMAPSPGHVMKFLRQLAEHALPLARNELDELRQFANETFGIKELEAWDVAYYSEKLRQERHNISQEEVKPYFPEHRVVEGMFEVVKKLYGIKIIERKDIDGWHKDVRFFEIVDREDTLRGQFYLDLYARENKRGGAWMDDCISRKRSNDGVQIPVAYLTCNFTPPVGDKPSLFTHIEVETLFHEFGHGLHHMLTLVDYISVAGTSGVAWDAVELPSQFLENWCWEKDALELISGHYETGQKFPDELFLRLKSARNFQSAMQTVRQLEFALFDFRIHSEFDPQQGARIDEILQQVRDQIAVIHPPSFNRFPHSFTHIFAGGYAAGYYSYKWAEVLSADAFSAFEEKGIFDRETGKQFLTAILEQGGSRDPMDLFIEFRGREPTIDALLRHSGLVAV